MGVDILLALCIYHSYAIYIYKYVKCIFLKPKYHSYIMKCVLSFYVPQTGPVESQTYTWTQIEPLHEDSKAQPLPRYGHTSFLSYYNRMVILAGSNRYTSTHACRHEYYKYIDHPSKYEHIYIYIYIFICLNMGLKESSITSS
jgi:hypothetical protein